MIIADANVVSEFMRDAPDPAVLDWAQTHATGALGICVVTVEEIERGLARLPQGRLRRDVTERCTRLVDAFADTVAVYDVTAARATAHIRVEAEATGRPMTLADAQIAGICLAGDHELATRNTRDFSAVADLTLINPFG